MPNKLYFITTIIYNMTRKFAMTKYKISIIYNIVQYVINKYKINYLEMEMR